MQPPSLTTLLRTRHHWRLAMAAALALGVHGVGAAAIVAVPGAGTAAAEEPSIAIDLELASLPSLATLPAPSEMSAPALPAKARRWPLPGKPRLRRSADTAVMLPQNLTPPPQAAAAQAADGPLDLTDTVTVVGKPAATPASFVARGPATSAAGTAPHGAIGGEVSGLRAAADRGAGGARPVMLAGSDWRCPWPSGAAASEKAVEIAVIRVVVNPDGTASAAEVLSDPGFGFGAAAVHCARSTRFIPALDRNGRLVRAQSPPIRVKFTR